MWLDQVYEKSPYRLQTLLLNAHALRIYRHRYGRRLDRAIKAISRFEYSTREEIVAFQNKRLREVVSMAYAHSSYYRAVMDERGITPADVGSTEGLRQLPLLDKETVRRHPGQLRTKDRLRADWLEGSTSGTTGSPLALWYDRRTCVMTNAVDERQKTWGGMGGEDWIGLFLGRMIVSADRIHPPFWQPNLIHKQLWFSTFHMGDATLPSYVAEIRRRGLRFLEGYPSTLFILAKHIVETGERLPMTAVFTSSETLHRVQREVITEAFACPIFDFYGLAERVIFATECDVHDGKHLAETYGITEVVDEQGEPVADGQPGYLVGTSLWNEAMPLLRYRTNDVSAIRRDPCQCGRSLLRIESVTTKAEDIVVTPEGRMISPSILTHPFKPFPQIRKSQIVQEELGRVVVKLVTTDEFTPELGTRLRELLSERLGPGIQIDFTAEEDIPPDPSGKFRWVISRVGHPDQFSWGDSEPTRVSQEGDAPGEDDPT